MPCLFRSTSMKLNSAFDSTRVYAHLDTYLHTYIYMHAYAGTDKVNLRAGTLQDPHTHIYTTYTHTLPIHAYLHTGQRGIQDSTFLRAAQRAFYNAYMHTYAYIHTGPRGLHGFAFLRARSSKSFLQCVVRIKCSRHDEGAFQTLMLTYINVHTHVYSRSLRVCMYLCEKHSLQESK
jgi:hypothetical protein